MTIDPKQPEAQEAPASEREAIAWDFNLWRRELMRLADQYHEASSAARGRFRDALYAHASNVGMHWRARAALGKQPTQEAPSAVLTEQEIDDILIRQTSLEAAGSDVFWRADGALVAKDELRMFAWECVHAARRAQEAPPRTTEKDVELIERMQKSIVDLHRETAEIDKEYGLSSDDAWKKAVDDELALCESTVSSFPDARAAVRGLIDWHVRKQEAPADAKDAARYRDALVWALGAGDDFRPQGTMHGKFWWRGELAERAGLTWDGERYIDSALQSHQEGGKP